MPLLDEPLIDGDWILPNHNHKQQPGNNNQETKCNCFFIDDMGQPEKGQQVYRLNNHVLPKRLGPGRQNTIQTPYQSEQLEWIGGLAMDYYRSREQEYPRTQHIVPSNFHLFLFSFNYIVRVKLLIRKTPHDARNMGQHAAQKLGQNKLKLHCQGRKELKNR